MLSRFIFRAVRLPAVQSAAIRPLSTSAISKTTIGTDHEVFTNEKLPERDHINFPRRKRPIEPAPVRYLIFPEEWFQFFYEKTGVSGPYMFAAGLTTFLVSKELWVLEHEFYCGVAVFLALGLINNAAGPALKAYLCKEADAHEASLKAIQQTEIDKFKEAINEEENAQWMATSYEALIEAKKENVALQLEAEYRNRMFEAYKQVKRRLDYQLEVSNVLRRNEQKHMVNWILGNVKKSITAKQEEDALKKCIADLKALA